MDIVRKSNSKQFVELNAKLKMIELLEERGQDLYDLEELQYFSDIKPLYKTVYLLFHLVNSLGF